MVTLFTGNGLETKFIILEEKDKNWGEMMNDFLLTESGAALKMSRLVQDLHTSVSEEFFDLQCFRKEQVIYGVSDIL